MSVEGLLGKLGLGFLNLSKQGFTYGPMGKLLRRNIEGLWFDHCVTMPRYNVFLTSFKEINDTLKYLRSARVDNTPFGLATLENSNASWNQSFFPPNCNQVAHKTATVAMISDESAAKDLFHRKQRERKVWWRKLARCPSKFTLSEAKRTKNYDMVEVQAQFPFGNIVVETITYQHGIQNLFSQDESLGSNILEARVVTHVASLDWGCLAFLCDGCNDVGESIDLHLHPKLSPYKVTFQAPMSDVDTDSERDDLQRLVIYLNDLLRAKGLDTVMTYDTQCVEKFRVPFVITVDKMSLKNGIVKVISQLTTIGEAVHVSELAKYVVSHCA